MSREGTVPRAETDRPMATSGSRRQRRSTTDESDTGFRPSSRRRARLAIGVGLAAIAVAGNIAVYSSLDERVEVLLAAVEIPAGAPIEAAQLRVVTVAVDTAVQVVSVDERAAVIGKYARAPIAAGVLVTPSALADTPLVSPGAAVVSLRLPEGSIPDGVVERSHVLVVASDPVAFVDRTVDAGGREDVVGDGAGDHGRSDGAVAGVIVGAVEPAGVGTVAVSVEVDVDDSVRVARADQVRIVLIAPENDAEGES